MSFVGIAFSLSRDRKRLTGKAGGPDFPVLGETGEGEGAGPSADPGEEMALPKRSQIGGFDLKDASLIDLARGQKPALHQLPQPCGGEPIPLIIIDAYSTVPSISFGPLASGFSSSIHFSTIVPPPLA